MFLGLVIYIALFLVLFATIYAIHEGVMKDAFWGIILAWWFGALTVVLTFLGLVFVDPFYTTILVLFSIMRFGMEQADGRPSATDGTRKARRELLAAFRVTDIYDKIRAHIDALPEESRLGHFIRLRISDTSFGRFSLSLGIRISAPLAIFRKLASIAPRVVVGVNQNPATGLFYWLCGILLIFTAGAKVVYIATGGEARAEFLQNIREAEGQELARKFAVGKHLGEFLGTESSGTKTLLITKGPSLTDGEGDSAFQRGLTEGLSVSAPVAGTAIVPRPTPPKVVATGPDRGVKTEKEFDYLTPAFFDEAVDSHPQCGLVVCTTGLPKELAKMKFWKKEDSDRPKLVLVNTPLSPVLKPLKLGFVAAVIVSNPRLEERVELNEKSAKEVFDASCLVIRADNLDEMEKHYPALFQAAR